MRKTPIRNGEWYHVYNRGVSRQTIFHDEKDYERFLWKMKEYKQRHGIVFAAYCLMPSHFHFLIKGEVARDTESGFDTECLEDGSPESFSVSGTPQSVPDTPSIPLFMNALQKSYAQYYNLKHEHSGALFQGRYQAKHVAHDAYFVHLMNYIHLNPQIDGITRDAQNWPYSSLLDLLRLRSGTMVAKNSLPIDSDYADLFAENKGLYEEQKIMEYIL